MIDFYEHNQIKKWQAEVAETKIILSQTQLTLIVGTLEVSHSRLEPFTEHEAFAKCIADMETRIARHYEYPEFYSSTGNIMGCSICGAAVTTYDEGRERHIEWHARFKRE